MERPAFYFLICPDAELLKEQRLELLKKYCPDRASFKTSLYWADDGLGQGFWNTLTMPDLLGGQSVLILRRSEQLAENDWKQIARALSAYNEYCFPLFCLEANFDKGGPVLPKALTKRKMWEFAKDRKWVWQSPGLNQLGVRKRLEKWAKQSRIAFEPGVQERLTSMLPMDGAALKAELGKLELSLQGGGSLPISAADLLIQGGTFDIFSFISGLQKGASPLKIWSEILGASSDSSSFFAFLSLMARDARQLWMCVGGEEDQARLPPYVRHSKRALAVSIGKEGISTIFDLIIEAENGVKSGQRNPTQAFELMLAGLLDVFSGASGRTENLLGQIPLKPLDAHRT